MEKSKIYMYLSQWGMLVGAPGLSLYTFDTETGEVQKVKQLVDDLSFGCSKIDAEKQMLYLCNECDIFPEVPYNTGRIYCYKIDAATGNVSLVNRKETHCSFTSYLNTSPDGKYMVVSNHSMPNFSTTVERGADGTIHPVLHHQDSLMNLFTRNEDGSIGEMVDFAKHEGIHKTLHNGLTTAHPHSVIRSPSGKLYACCDKGDGHLYLYTIENGKLKLLSKTLTDVAGSEPRHCAFHPRLPYLFINHEHTPGDRITLTTFRYDEDGRMEKISSFHADVTGYEPVEHYRQQQGLCISPDGRYIYTQAHGYNLLLTLAVDETTGQLRQIQATPIEGEWPRALNMSPDGKFLINCCLAGQITVYRVGEDGMLSDTGHRGFSKGAGGVSFFDPHK